MAEEGTHANWFEFLTSGQPLTSNAVKMSSQVRYSYGLYCTVVVPTQWCDTLRWSTGDSESGTNPTLTPVLTELTNKPRFPSTTIRARTHRYTVQTCHHTHTDLPFTLATCGIDSARVMPSRGSFNPRIFHCFMSVVRLRSKNITKGDVDDGNEEAQCWATFNPLWQGQPPASFHLDPT
ncbi:hypothetical protein CBL_06193 [Carabus blaptoides fortunei]